MYYLLTMIYNLKVANYSQEELLERLKKFSLDVLRIVKSLPLTEENKIYGKQVIRSSSSIGANYSEASCAHTRQDFLHDINKCRKEAKETLYWLGLIRAVNKTVSLDIILEESSQILKIFISSVKTTKNNILNNKNTR